MPDEQPNRRLRFSLRQLFLAVALIAVGLGIWNWVFRKEVVVRAPEADEVFFKYDLSPSDVYFWKSPRNVAIVTGRFQKGMLLVVSLYTVESSVVHFRGEDSLGFVTDTTGSIWESQRITLVIGERWNDGTLAGLRIVWEDQDRRPWRALPEVEGWPDNTTVAKETLPGTITPGRPHVVYVEGDQKIVVDGKMTLEEFARANPGNYLVVTVEVR